MYDLIFNERYIATRGIPFDEIATLKEIAVLDKIEQHIFAPPDDTGAVAVSFSSGTSHWDKVLAFLMSTTEHHADMEHFGVKWIAKSLPVKIKVREKNEPSRIARWVRISRKDSVMIGVVLPHYYVGEGLDQRFVLYSNDETFHPIIAVMLDHFIQHSEPKPPLFTIE